MQADTRARVDHSGLRPSSACCAGSTAIPEYLCRCSEVVRARSLTPRWWSLAHWVVAAQRDSRAVALRLQGARMGREEAPHDVGEARTSTDGPPAIAAALTANPVVTAIVIAWVRRHDRPAKEHRLDQRPAPRLAIYGVADVLAAEVVPAEYRRACPLDRSRLGRRVVCRVAKHLEMGISEVARGFLEYTAVAIVLQHHQRYRIVVVTLGTHVRYDAVDRPKESEAGAGDKRRRRRHRAFAVRQSGRSRCRGPIFVVRDRRDDAHRTARRQPDDEALARIDRVSALDLECNLVQILGFAAARVAMAIEPVAPAILRALAVPGRDERRDENEAEAIGRGLRPQSASTSAFVWRQPCNAITIGAATLRAAGT